MSAIAYISQSALTSNLSVVKHYAADAKIVAVLKANAYGHRIEWVKPLINGADLVAVSSLSEAENLRAISQKPILLLGGVSTEAQMQHAIRLNCHIVVYEKTQIKLINSTKKPLVVWIKIDTGMHRLGLLNQEYKQCIELFNPNPLIKTECVMSHFSCADEPKNPINNTQLTQFLQSSGSRIKRSIANSAAIMSNKNTLFDFVRPGIMLYGISPFAVASPNLQPVMTLTAPILSIKILESGANIGYGACFRASKKTTIAILGIGYADGYPRHAKNNTPILINGTICPLVGRVSMDLITVDISNINAKIGDFATLWGAGLPVETIATWSDTIAYELVTKVSARVKFQAVK